MLLTMFLLGLLYVVFVAVLVALKIPLVLVLLIAGGFLFFQYFFSDRIALATMRGREVTPEQAPELHQMVDRLCALADMPKPRVAIADSDVPNAFATGRNQKHAVVCVTTGILRRLSAPELEAVLSHELSHVAHRDVAVMTLASFLGILAGFVVRSSIYAGAYGGGGWGRSSNDRDNNAGAVILLVVLASAVVYALSFLLTRLLSRYRELSADRAGAILIGRPSLLAAALVKITGEMGRIPTRDLRAAEPLNAFFFAPALAPGFSFSSLFATHPPLDRRLEQLAELEAQLGRPA
jgi:heat shock protein HtpX